MSDPNLEDFYGRVARIERDHAHGRTFVAAGTLALPVRRRRRDRLALVIRTSAFALVFLVCVKAASFALIGVDVGHARIEALRDGTAFERAGAALFAPDPLSVWLAGHLARLF